MPMSSETRHALKVNRDYLEGLNEAVQYDLELMTDQVTASSSEIIGGFQVGQCAVRPRGDGRQSRGIPTQCIPHRSAGLLCGRRLNTDPPAPVEK